MSIKNNIENIKKTIPKHITILAATKTHSLEEIKEAIGAGIGIIGENYVQEAERKFRKLKGKVKFHCIGHLQTNKVKKGVKIFDMIQTVDSEKIAREIDKMSRNINKIMSVLIEVNIAKEPNKSGCMPEGVIKLSGLISKLKNIKLKGLMTMAPFFEDSEKTRPYFKKTKKLFDELQKSFPDIDTLSMGMSDSYKAAIEEGATMVRLGAVIFGGREVKEQTRQLK